MRKILFNAEETRKIQAELLASLLADYPDTADLVLVGIERRGADLARRLTDAALGLGHELELGSLDINLYRDDWTIRAGGMPHMGQSAIPCDLTDKTVILVDDVLFSGRTIRAALEALLDYGRPARVRLLVFVDRGHRELPICPDYVGRVIATEKNQRVDALFSERDGKDEVALITGD